MKNVTLNVRKNTHDGRQLHVDFVQLGEFIHSVLESVFPVSFASFIFPFFATSTSRLEFATPAATCSTVCRYLVQF